MYLEDIEYGRPDIGSIEEELSRREEERVLEGVTNQCPIINPPFTGRICPADGVSKCKDCPF